MIDKAKQNALVGVSSIAVSVILLIAPARAQDCTATVDDDDMTVVDCAPGESSAPFATSFSDTSAGAPPTYDGEGPDVINMLGGVIIVDDGLSPPVVDDSYNLDSANGAIETLGDDDTFNMTAGTIGASGNPVHVRLGDGADVFNMTGGSLFGSIYGDGGADTVNIIGGSVDGSIDAETVNLTGGTIGGDITGLSGSTLTINDSLSPDPLSLRDGVLFSGIDAVGTIANTELAAGGFQSFSGFSSLSIDNSTLGFSGGQVIDQLNLTGGSTLFVNGNVSLLARSSGFGNLSAAGSSIRLDDGDVSDRLALGNLVFSGSTLGLDINQATGQGDQLLVNGTFTATGSNTILVNLLGTPNFRGTTEIPIVEGDFDIDPTVFSAEGIPGTVASLFDYELRPGSLILVATPGDLSPALATPAAIDSLPVLTALDLIDSITDDAAEFGLVLSGGGTPVHVAPSFGIFASGQFARVNHDGFNIRRGAFTATGPSFASNDFSAAVSLDFNAAKHFQFDNQYGLNIGLFGGYTSSAVSLNPFLAFPSVGGGHNASGMFGAYGLFRHRLNYLLVSASAFLGHTDIVNNVLASTGGYGTTGYAVTASAGHIFPLSDTLRFDLRGGILGVTFTGHPYTDSLGNQFGQSWVSFGAVKFDPGIYMDRQLENGMIFSPYARLELQHRFGYRNTASLSGIEFAFDDADFSASLSGGFNLKVTPRSTVSAEVRGKASHDSTTLSGKIGLKASF